MNEKTQRQIFNILKKKGIKKFIGVPDSTMKYFIDEKIMRIKFGKKAKEKILSNFTLNQLDDYLKGISTDI